MSGAAEGIAGLALSAVSVAALFTTCIECFDIVVAGRNFSEDYEQLCALFSVQRLRFGLWGESVGLVPNPNHGRRLRYNKNIDRPDIRPGIERILNNIKSLLEEAGQVDARYGSKPNATLSPELSLSKGLDIFKGSFERFKSRIKKHQKETSAWKATRWAIHDAKKFEEIINRLKDFVDGLESLTTSLGFLEEQRQQLRREIESISDTQSLRLLRDASSRHGSTQRDVSDAASQRLITLSESFVENQTIDSGSQFLTVTDSFVTAKSRFSTISGSSLLDEKVKYSSAKLESFYSTIEIIPRRGSFSKIQPRTEARPSSSCEQCQEEHYKCMVVSKSGPCARCVQITRHCSFLLQVTSEDIDDTLDVQKDFATLSGLEPNHITQELPQNQRLLADVLRKAKPRTELSFAAGDAHYGNRLATVKAEDEKYWLDHCVKILTNAHFSTSAAKRMFFELRNIKMGSVPFVSAVPLDDNVNKVLASIEGPPETPYEGGVFWITVKLSNIDPFGPPLMRFHTKIYHPNISPQGHICANYKENWNSPFFNDLAHIPVTDSRSLWYPTKSRDCQWSLGALLTALCGLLGTPDVDDPLVPEIAQKFLEDYDGYCKNAKLYTQLYATGARPDAEELSFSEDLPWNGSEKTTPEFNKNSDLTSDSHSLQSSTLLVPTPPFHSTLEEESLIMCIETAQGRRDELDAIRKSEHSSFMKDDNSSFTKDDNSSFTKDDNSSFIEL